MDKIYSRKRFLIPKIIKRTKLNYTSSSFKSGDSCDKKMKIKSNLANKSNQSKRDSIDLRKLKKAVKVLAILFIAVCFANKMLCSIQPLINTLSRDMAKSIAIKISNEQVTKIMRYV